MKLYNFEKYYLSFVLYKILIFTNKLLSYRIARYVVFGVLFIVFASIALSIVIYFFIGVNAFLSMIHLEQFRIAELPLGSSTIDLKPFYKK
jgi:hypothetical protein